MVPNRKARKARIVKVVASGACRLVRVRAGLELRVYGSKEEALDDGVRPEKVKMLFAGRKLLGLCRMWVQSDGTHFGTIWVRDRAGTSRMLVNPNPQIARWNLGTQEVIRWKNSHDENSNFESQQVEEQRRTSKVGAGVPW